MEEQSLTITWNSKQVIYSLVHSSNTNPWKFLFTVVNTKTCKILNRCLTSCIVPPFTTLSLHILPSTVQLPTPSTLSWPPEPRFHGHSISSSSAHTFRFDQSSPVFGSTIYLFVELHCLTTFWTSVCINIIISTVLLSELLLLLLFLISLQWSL
jgi:hypothetical protein